MRFVEQVIKKPQTINWRKDIVAGIIVALVSIPISMGYATIAGLPAVYGLYGSLLPILVFGLMTTSPQFVVGVDAMPAVMVGALMAEMGIVSGSTEAFNLAPIMALLTGCWFIVFFAFRADRVIKYISTPVMSGFISGIGITIILMQIPKLFGGTPGTGEILSLLENIWNNLQHFNTLSFVLGVSTIVIILVCKKLIPKVPMTIVVLVIGALAQVVFELDQYGVALLPSVTSGMPEFFIPDFSVVDGYWPRVLIQSASIAAVIMAQTLLASGNYAMKYNYKLNGRNELLSYAGMNIIAGITGVCPINGSVSRSGIADSSGCKSQVMSITASFTMLLVLLFATPVLGYLPVPVLTGIVMTALIGIVDFDMAYRLFKCNKNELLVFLASLLAVLFFGTVNGVLIGVVLSFGEVAVNAVNPPDTFIGRIPGHGNFHSLNRNSNAKAIQGAVIYRFNGNLFFANIDKFVATLENAVRPNTKCVIIDARGITSIDITAIDRLVILNDTLMKSGIEFYITEHDGSLNDIIRKNGGDALIKAGAIRQTISLALRDVGIDKPYPLEDCDSEEILEMSGMHIHDIKELTEFEWLYGDAAQEQIKLIADKTAEEIATATNPEELEADILDGNSVHTRWGSIGLFDEDKFLELMDKRLDELLASGKLSHALREDIEKHIKARHEARKHHLINIDPQLKELISKHHQELREYIVNKKSDEGEN